MTTSTAPSKKLPADQDGKSYEEITYEGYGPSGVAVMVKCLTDNKNRTATSVRTAFSKNGGLGETGCVSYMFDRKGYIAIEREDLEIDEEEFMLEVIDAGAEELETSEELFEIYTEPEQFEEVKKSLEERGYKLATSEITMVPQTYAEVDEALQEKVEKLIDVLEDDDDVQEVYTNVH